MITVTVRGGFSKAMGLWQYDYGQILRIQGLKLPTAVEIHFSLQEKGGESVTRIGITKDGVTDVPIPDSMLENGDTARDYEVYAFIYLTDETSGQTEYKISMPVKARPKPEAWAGNEGTTAAEVLKAVNQIANGKADGLEYKNGVLKLMSGEKELGSVNINDFPTGLLSSIVTEVVSETTAIVDITNLNFVGSKWKRYLNDTQYNMIRFDYNGESRPVLGAFGILNIRKTSNAIQIRSNNLSFDFKLIDGDWRAVTYVYATTDDVLTKTNTAEYIPTNRYHPATKKYVDDSVKTPRKEINQTNFTLNMMPNTLYVCTGVVQTITPMFIKPLDSSGVNEYRVIFTSGATATVIDWTLVEQYGSGPIILPPGFTVKPNKIYELSILENLLTYQEWDYNGVATE